MGKVGKLGVIRMSVAADITSLHLHRCDPSLVLGICERAVHMQHPEWRHFRKPKCLA